MQLQDVYVADFEATTEKQYNEEGRVRVWGVGVRSILSLSTVLRRNNIDDFMRWCLSRRRKTRVYFHNLEYDGEFIIHWLLENGHRHTPAGEDPRERDFTTLISGTGKIFSIRLYLKIYDKDDIHVEFRCSYKKLPFALADVAKMLDLDVRKGTIDYERDRPEGAPLTKEDALYLDNDTYILAKAMRALYFEGFEKLTTASDAMFHVKRFVGFKNFDYIFPRLNIEVDRSIRQALRGGWVYVNPLRKHQTLGENIAFDVNSLYPYIMAMKPLPYGVPIYYKGEYQEDEKYPLYIQRVIVNGARLKKGHLPSLQVKNNLSFIPTEYITDTGETSLEVAMTSLDLALFKEQYNVDNIEYIDGFKFRSQKGVLADYVSHWMQVKENSKGAQRLLAKLRMNSPFGKFAQNPEHTRKIPSMEDERVIYETVDSEPSHPIYTAYAIFVTAWGRYITISTAQLNYERFIYADTDSIHLLGSEPPEGVEVHDTKLGAWKSEGVASRARYLRPKSYARIMQEPKGDKLLVKCAGMPKEVKKNVTFDDFQMGAVFGGKLQLKKVKGGAMLKEIDFTINK